MDDLACETTGVGDIDFLLALELGVADRAVLADSAFEVVELDLEDTFEGADSTDLA